MDDFNVDFLIILSNTNIKFAARLYVPSYMKYLVAPDTWDIVPYVSYMAFWGSVLLLNLI